MNEDWRNIKLIRENKGKRNPFVHAFPLYTNTLADVHTGSICRIWKGGLSPSVSGYWLAIHLHNRNLFTLQRQTGQNREQAGKSCDENNSCNSNK